MDGISVINELKRLGCGPTPTPTPTPTPQQVRVACGSANQPRYTDPKYDINRDGQLDMTDGDAIIKVLNDRVAYDPKYDINNDGKFTAMDVLQVTNELNRLGCVPTPTPTATPTATRTPTPLAAPNASQCLWGVGWANYSGYLIWSGSGTSAVQFGAAPNDQNRSQQLETLARQFGYREAKALPSCFTTKWKNECLSHTDSRSQYKGTLRQSASTTLYGGCSADATGLLPLLGLPYEGFIDNHWNRFFAGLSPQDYAPNTPLARYLESQGYTVNQLITKQLPYAFRRQVVEMATTRASFGEFRRCLLSSQINTPQCSFLGWVGSRITGSTTWFMDQNCRAVEAPQDTKVCGFGGVSWSPISLLWEDASLERDMRVVPFSLDPSKPDGYALWKGSAKAPLLVFDPEHTGKVTSAKQLFGNFTFGGAGAKRGDGSVEPWRDGYEALGSLDADHSGAIEGAELDPIALWFDKDRDAEVDPGELTRAKESGVVSLSYREPKQVNDSMDLRIEAGFAREVGAKIVTGASVDWYSNTFVSKEEALQAFSPLIGAEGGTKQQASYGDNWQSNPIGFKPHKTTNHAHDMSGFWMWHIVGEHGVKHPGVFAFEQTNSDTLYGFSLVEMQLETNGQGLHTAIKALPATGRVIRGPNGERTISLDVTDSESGVTARSTASLTEGGVVLRGTTSQTLVRRDSAGKEQSASVTYDWIGQKFVK